MDSLGALHFPKLVGLVLLLRHSQLRNDYLVRFFSRSVSSDFCFSGVSFKHQFFLRGNKNFSLDCLFFYLGKKSL